MFIKNEDYAQMTKKASPDSPKLRDYVFAFSVGGMICVIGELLGEFYLCLGSSKKTASVLVAVSLIAVAAILTGFKLYEKIAQFAGSGTLVPITGFANAVVAPAIEFKREGYVTGVGVKIFSIAGPVILFGTVASVLYGVVYYITAVLF